MRSLPRAAAVAALALLAAALPACGGRDRELTVVYGSDVLTLDPNERFETVTDSYAMNVFEPLLRFDWKGSFVPVLALRWDIPDGKTWRFSLRPGVKFHDGTPLTAKDVAFSIRRVIERESSELHPYLKSVDSVAAPDDLTVEVSSSRPAGLLPALSFVYVLPERSLRSAGEEAFFRSPSGTGPYRLVERKPGESLRLEAWDGYWGSQPAFRRAELRFVVDELAMWKAAEERRTSIVVGPTWRSWKLKQGLPGFRFLIRPGLAVQFLTAAMQPGRKLADVRVRRALLAALDRKSLAEQVMTGGAFAASQFVSPGIVGYNPNLAVPPFERGKARRLLEEAGHPNGIALTLTVVEGAHRLADEIVRQLGAEGIEVKRVPVPARDMYERGRLCTEDLALTGWICSTGDGAELLEGAFGHGPESAAHGEGALACGYRNPRLAELIDLIAQTLEPRARQRLLQESMSLLVDDVPWFPLFVADDRYAVSEEIVWEPRPDSEVYLPDVKPR